MAETLRAAQPDKPKKPRKEVGLVPGGGWMHDQVPLVVCAIMGLCLLCGVCMNFGRRAGPFKRKPSKQFIEKQNKSL